jgi:EAL domain-containing protein (putative c-di-GMP-specific phosphodiesterase class I)
LFAQENKLDFQFYDRALNQHFFGKNQRYEKLREAVYNNQLTLHYQPQIDLASGQVVGAEALARWFDTADGMILPGKFIPMIESTGLLHRFSMWTVETAIRDCAQWQEALPGVSVSINLSSGALMDAEVLHSFEQSLRQWKLDPALVIVELTESVLLNSPAQALARIERLLRLGARLSIDDYGAGFSSLTYLKQLPAHEMKIDMSFVQQLASNEKDQAIVKSSIALGHDLHLSVLAEGIEDAAALNMLILDRCDLGQGWYFSKALPLADFIAWVPPLISIQPSLTAHHADTCTSASKR